MLIIDGQVIVLHPYQQTLHFIFDLDFIPFQVLTSPLIQLICYVVPLAIPHLQGRLQECDLLLIRELRLVQWSVNVVHPPLSTLHRGSRLLVRTRSVEKLGNLLPLFSWVVFHYSVVDLAQHFGLVSTPRYLDPTKPLSVEPPLKALGTGTDFREVLFTNLIPLFAFELFCLQIELLHCREHRILQQERLRGIPLLKPGLFTLVG